MKFHHLLAPLIIISSSFAAELTPAAQQACESARELSGAVRDCDMSWMADRMYPPLKRLYANQYSMKSEKARSVNAQRYAGTYKESDEDALARMRENERALRDKYIEIGREMKAKGVRVESFTVYPAVSEYELLLPQNIARGVRRDSSGDTKADKLNIGSDRSRLVVLPTTLIISVPNPKTGERVRVEQKSHLYAVRDEKVEHGSEQNRGTKLNQWYFIDGKTEISTLRNFFVNIPLRLKLPINSSRQIK